MVIAFNWAINPYEYFDSGSSREDKPLCLSKHRILKAKDVQLRNIQAALIGSSRVLSGIGREDAEEILGKGTYNCGVSGAKFEEIYEYAKLLIKNQRELKTLVIGLDFFGFNEFYDFDADYNPSRFTSRFLYIPDFISCAFSLKALKDSAKFLMGILPESMHIDEMGYLSNIKEGETSREEHEKFELSVMKRYYHNGDTPNIYQKYRLSQKALRAFQELVSLCERKKINLLVYFTPAHHVYWQALECKGHWPLLEDFKREIVKIHPVWDFSGTNFFTGSRFLGDYSRWFYDVNHAKPRVGKQILNQMVKDQPNVLGILLNESNIEEHLLKLKGEQNQWALQNSESVDWVVRQLVDKAAR